MGICYGGDILSMTYEDLTNRHPSVPLHLFLLSGHALFMKSIRLRPKPDVPASEAFFLASMASRLLCFLALALFLLLEFADVVEFAFGLSFAGDGLGTPAPKE